jgi:hypothetical protein
VRITPDIRARIDSGDIPLGKIEGEPIDRYHATPAISASKLKVARRSLRYFKRKYIDCTLPPEPESEAKLLGSAVHALIEGRDAFLEQFAVAPEGIDRRTKDGKADWAAFLDMSAGKRVLKATLAKEAQEMADAINAHPAASALMQGVQREVSWRAEVNGLLMQCRTDIYGENTVSVPFADGVREVGTRVVDIKKTASLCADEFSNFHRQFFTLGYYRQAGFYSALLQMMVPPECRPASGWIPFFFVAVAEDTQEVFVGEPDADAMALGYEHATSDLRAVRDAFESDEWPGTPDTVQPLSLPAWMKKEVQP